MTSPEDRDRALPPRLDPRRGEQRGAASGKHGAGRHSRTAAVRRRPAAVLGKFMAAALSVAILATSGVMWGFYQKFNGEVHRVNAIDKHHATGGDIDGEDQNILIVGNDSRRGLTPEELKEVGTTADPGLDTDTILLLHLPADGKKASVISFPRDSMVKIPGFKDNKINAAYADGACYPAGCGNELTDKQKAGGSQLLIKTVSELTGLQIDHYVEVSLLGFYKLSNIVGGVDICLRQRAYDPGFTNLDLSAGHHLLKGTQALLFVRQRHHLPGGDLDRITRQQVFISAVLRKILKAGTLLNPLRLNKLVGSVAQSLTLDDGLDPIKLADQMRNVAAGNVTFTTIPIVGPAKVDGKDVLVINPDQVRSFVDRIIGKKEPATPPSAPPTTSAAPDTDRSAVNVAVYNGTTTAQLAAKTQGELADAGFTVAAAANADRSDYTTTEIRYAASEQDAANTLASVVPGAQLQQDDSLGGTIDLVLGSDFTGLQNSAAPPTATSAPPADTSSSDSDTADSGKPEKRTAADTSCID